jgi:ABC-2 type transport system ATP-binding protein
MVRNLVDLGKTVFLTTHYMDEAEALANRVAVIARGEIVAEGPPKRLGDRAAATTRISMHVPDGSVPPALRAGVVSDGSVHLRTDDPARVLHELTGWALETGDRLDGLEVSKPTLEDVYLELTGGEAGTG